MVKIKRLLHKNPKRWKGNLLIVKLLNSNSAFSFFHYIFLGELLKAEDQVSILQHEQVHVEQKHTLDLLFFELLRIVFWFNPFVYIYQSRIVELHEYIADAKSVEHQNKAKYYQNLLSQVFDTQHISFVNPFFKQSLIKKRIIMISKSKSKQIHLVKYALLVPLVLVMLIYTSSYAQEIKKGEIPQAEKVNQEYTLQELTEKYYQEIIELFKNKSNENLIFKNYMPDLDKYINTKDEIAKLQAFFKYMSERRIEKKRKEGSLTSEDIEGYEKVLNRYKTYEDYLAYQKTDQAKLNWESSTRDGVLRLVVDDFKNLSEEEQKRYDKKMKMIENDDYFHSLLMTNGKTITMKFSEIGSKKTSNPSDKVDFEIDDESIEVPFSVIDEVPIYPGCESLATNEERKNCMSDNIALYVNKNFNTKLGKELGLTGRQRINVIFKIDSKGNITDVHSRAPHPDLEAEAIRVVNSLPQMVPGKQRGKNVIVPYSLPIIFQVGE
jgi:hypothetical protein